MPDPASPTRTRSGSAARHRARSSVRRRRGRVVDPEAEARTCRRLPVGAVEDDVVGARRGPQRACGEARPAELVDVRVVVERQRRVAGEPVLVAGGDDAWLDLRARPRDVITTPKFATGRVMPHAEHLLRARERGSDTAPPAGTSG